MDNFVLFTGQANMQGVVPTPSLLVSEERTARRRVGIALTAVLLIATGASSRQLFFTPLGLGLLGGFIQSLRRDYYQMPTTILPYVAGFLVASNPSQIPGVMWIPLIAMLVDWVCGGTLIGSAYRGGISFVTSALVVIVMLGCARLGLSFEQIRMAPRIVTLLVLWVACFYGSIFLLRKLGFGRTTVRASSFQSLATFSIFTFLTAWMHVAIVQYGESSLGLLLGYPMLAFVFMRNATKNHQENMNKALYGFARLLNHAHPYTGAHSKRVSDLAETVGLRLGIYDKRLDQLKHAALLHDIGKLAVDEDILEKPGRLTDEEFESVKLHAEHGARILRLVWDFGPVSHWVRYHHERMDGRGYPKGIAGEEIPIESRVISAIDAFDAMTGDDADHRRPYRKCVSPQEGMTELKRCVGTQFDEDVVQAFEEVLSERSLI